MTIVDRIRNLSDVSLHRLEQELGFSNSTISNWAGKNNPSATALYAVAKRLNTSMEYLLTGVEPTYNENAVIAKPELDEDDKQLIEFRKMFIRLNDRQKSQTLGYMSCLLETGLSVPASATD